jgi:alkylhydroperoxidase/carboxymuconolactone decarboxylase family protein YurZ
MAETKPMKEFAGLFYREGALDPKTLQLVALAAMAAAGCTS